MYKIILTSLIGIFIMTGCSVKTSDMVAFNATNADYSKEYKMAEDCRIKIPVVAQIQAMINGPHLINARKVAAENGISKIAYFEVEERPFKVCFTVYGE